MRALAVLETLAPAAWWNGRHSRLKICFWETGVPVRIRPRPPLRKHARLTLDFRFALISTEFSPSHPHVSNENGFVAGPQMNAIETTTGDMMAELVAAGSAVLTVRVLARPQRRQPAYAG